MLNIEIKTIPHAEQRCKGNPGDYWLENGGRELQVRISELSDWRFEFLIAAHELIEYFLCKHKGIDEPHIQAFDEQFYNEKELGMHADIDEAGNSPDAPYHWQHVIATVLEKGLSHLLGVDWEAYGNEVDALMYAKPKPQFEGMVQGVPHAEDS